MTGRINILRGETLPAANAAKTHCPAKHEYDLLNTAYDRKGSRYCKECKRIKALERYHRRRAVAAT